jgi:hypothetical protein
MLFDVLRSNIAAGPLVTGNKPLARNTLTRPA